MLEKHIVLNDADPAVFYGVNNTNMQLLKALFPKLRIVARGNVLRIMGDEEETDTLDIGEKRVIRLVTAQIPDACFSESGLIDLAIVARDKTYESNDAVEARGAKTLSAATK